MTVGAEAAFSLRLRLLRGGSWVIAGKLATAGSNLVMASLAASLLAPEPFADYLLAYSLGQIGWLVASLGMSSAVVRLVAESLGRGRPDRARGAVRAAFGWGLAGIAGVALLLLTVGGWILRHGFDAPLLAASIVLATGWVVLNTLQILTSETFRGLHDMRAASVFGGVLSGALLVVLLGTTRALVTQTSLRTVLLLVLVASAASLLCAAPLLRRKLQALGPAARLDSREVLQVALPLWLNGLLAFGLQQCDLWILGAASERTELAVYGAASRLVILVSTPLVLVNMIVPPFIAELDARGERARLERLLRATATLAGLPALGVLLLFVVCGGPLLRLAYHDELYRSGALVLAILSVGKLVDVWVGPCQMALSMTGHQLLLMRITLVTSVLTVLAGAAVAGRGGGTGLALVFCAGLIVQDVWVWLATRRATGMWTHLGLPRRADLSFLLRRGG
ncbi:MAG TPA: oligosaccharide flippase family protein [Candidatus Polarisedimenticolaceae bacterium]|nr:oligosaccharide flippase family protein [Candidatus Polarisedimenticolaceae bacterium]